jgi:hypothetical protein
MLSMSGEPADWKSITSPLSPPMARLCERILDVCGTEECTRAFLVLRVDLSEFPPGDEAGRAFDDALIWLRQNKLVLGDGPFVRASGKFSLKVAAPDVEPLRQVFEAMGPDPIDAITEAITSATADGRWIDVSTGKPGEGQGDLTDVGSTLRRAHHAHVRTAVEGLVAHLRGEARKPRRAPTISELEAILATEGGKVEVLPPQ